MASDWSQLQDGGLNALLSTLLDDVVPMSSVQAMPLPQWLDSSLPTSAFPYEGQHGIQGNSQHEWHSNGDPARAVLTFQDQQGPAGTGSANTAVDDRKPASKRSSSTSRSGNRGVRLRKEELEQKLWQQQEQLRQQLHRRLYLTERLAVLEQLISMRESTEELLQTIQAGLTYNPFAVFNTDVQSFVRGKPDTMAQRFIHGVQCLASRLACIGPLLQKYPQLCTHRPSHDTLNQLKQQLSLAEPTNPYGADGLPVGSLTVPVPAHVMQAFAAAYSLDLPSVSATERAMLETCATLIIEQWCMTTAYRHAFFMLPELHLGSAVHVQEAKDVTSWEDITAMLSRLTADDTSGSSSMLAGNSGTFVANEDHWRGVVANVGLTDKQKLQAAILWEIISGARNSIHTQRASIAQKLSHLLSPAAPQQTSTPTSSATTVSGGSQSSQAHGSGSSAVSAARDQNQHDSAVAALSCSSEQLTQRETLMQRLNNTLMKERLLMNLANAVMYAYILGVVQVSKVAVHSYPFLPGHQAILSCCAAECTPAVLERLSNPDSKESN